MSDRKRLLRQLSRAGLDPALVRQLDLIGSDAVPAMRKLLDQGPKGIRDINSVLRRIETTAGRR